MGENKFLAPSIVLEGSKHLQEAKTRWVYNPDILSYIIKNSTKNQLTLMLYYLGNSDGWICSDLGTRTGITDKGNLSRTRKELENKGWITYSPTDKTITVHLDTLFQKTTSAKIAEMGL